MPKTPPLSPFVNTGPGAILKSRTELKSVFYMSLTGKLGNIRTTVLKFEDFTLFIRVYLMF